jgi:putative membrane-bound dehydrogenase-like protein
MNQKMTTLPWQGGQWQFGLRLLLLVIFAATLGSAWYAYEACHRAEVANRQQEFNATGQRQTFGEAQQHAERVARLAVDDTTFPSEREYSHLTRRTGIAARRVAELYEVSTNATSADPRSASIAVPPGFTVEVAASSPLIEHPVMAGFDDRGRLFVAENAGKNLKREDLEKELPNSIVLLTDTDGDGVFDKKSVFADKLTFPQGALWHDGWLYVASSGAIWRFRDTNNDDVADVREQIVSKFGYTGNAADVLGCFLGPEGRIYWCEGRHGHEITGKNGELISKGKAARIFSCNPDGSDVLVHCGGGMDNPTEIDWTSTGEMLGTVNIFYAQRGDCLVHWQHGGVYPRHDQPAVLAEFRRTGELLDAVHDFGHVAVSGTCRYRPFDAAGQFGFGKEFHNQWFVCEFNTHKVKRVGLKREGSSFRADVQDFLSSTNRDFHPTDVLQDADGSLLVVDTGGWFRIGCPVSQVAKPEITGAIYRIRRTDTANVPDPWGKKIAWDRTTAEELIEFLGDDRPAVRARAVATLVKNKDASVPYLAKAIHDEDTTRRLHAVETLTKIGTEKVTSVLLDALEHDDEAVRHLAAFGLGALREPQAVELLAGLLHEKQPPEIQLAAATALGKIGEPAAIPDLLESLARKADRPLEHALIYALIEIDDPAATRPALTHASPLVRRAGLIALDQMPSGDLQREEVAALLASGDLALQTAALDVISRRTGWTEELITSISNLLNQAELTEAQQTLIVGAIVAFSKQPQVQQLVAKQLSDERASSTKQQLLLEALAQCGLDPLPAELQEPLVQLLHSKQKETLLAAISVVGTTPRTFLSELTTLANDSQQPAEVRLAAFAASSSGRSYSDAEFSWLTSQLDSTVPPALRMTAARCLGAANLTADQQVALCKYVAVAGPLEIHSLLAAFEHPGNETIGKAIAGALRASPGSAALTLPQLDSLLSHYPASMRAELKPILDRLAFAAHDQRARLERLSNTLQGGNPAAGKQVFFNRQAGCYLCHRVGNDGGRVGPDLTKIGERRNQIDLLEAIIFPSASLARGFESHSFLLDDGRSLTGLIVRETADAVVVRTADQTEIRVPRRSIEEMKPSTLSIMPAGLENTMSRQQLADLIAYLQTLK